MAIKLALVAALLLRATACCCGASSLQGAVYNETLAKKGALWSSIAYGPPVSINVCMAGCRHVLNDG